MSELKTNKIATHDTNNVAVDNALNIKSYTTTQRNALTSATGDMIYNTTDSKVQVYDGSAWTDMGGFELLTISALVIAGGGCGGRAGGGAGAGHSSGGAGGSGGGCGADISQQTNPIKNGGMGTASQGLDGGTTVYRKGGGQ